MSIGPSWWWWTDVYRSRGCDVMTTLCLMSEVITRFVPSIILFYLKLLVGCEGFRRCGPVQGYLDLRLGSFVNDLLSGFG